MIRKLRRLAARQRATVKIERTPDWIDIEVIAPDGQVWCCSHTHVLTDSGHTGADATNLIAARMLQDVAEGTTTCDGETCGGCELYKESE